MTRFRETGFFILLIGLSFVVALLCSRGAGYVWTGRGLLALLTSAGGFLLSFHFTVALGTLLIPADLTLTSLVYSSEVINGVDFLVWAGYVLIALSIARFQEVREETDRETKNGESEREVKAQPETMPRNVEIHPEVLDDINPSERVRELIVNHLQRTHENMNTDNLLYFHVRDEEATPGYVINDHGSIDTTCSFGTDQARGVGWVLSHGDRLRLDSGRIDWRNLQYHNKPVDLARIYFEPVVSGNELIGVVALEWQSPVEVKETVLETHMDQMEGLMGVDQSVRRLERKERELDLFNRLSEFDPLSFDRIDTLRQRLKDLVRELIPANHVEFVTGDNEGEKNVVKQRRLFYETCREWIASRGDSLRIGDVGNFSYKGRKIGEIAPPDVSSFLGGAVQSDGEPFGYLFLDDTRESFFTHDDETVLNHLLERSSGMLKIASRFEDCKSDRRRLRNWIKDLSELKSRRNFRSNVEDTLKVFDERLPVEGAAFYQETSQEYSLLETSRDLPIPSTFDSESAFISQLRDCENKVTLEFPNLGPLSNFNRNHSIASLTICPWFSTSGELLGFLCLFCSTVDEKPNSPFEDLKKLWPIVERELTLNRQVSVLMDQSKRDPWTDFLEFDSWKKTLSSEMNRRRENDTMTVWSLRVPGFEAVAENRGRRQGLRWVKKVASFLESEFDKVTLTRAYSSVFYGFEPTSAQLVRNRIRKVAGEISSWSFPIGEWPAKPSCGAVSFQAFDTQEVSTMIETTRKKTLTNRNDD